MLSPGAAIPYVPVSLLLKTVPSQRALKQFRDDGYQLVEAINGLSPR